MNYLESKPDLDVVNVILVHYMNFVNKNNNCFYIKNLQIKKYTNIVKLLV